MISLPFIRALWLCALTTEEAFTEVLDGRLTSKEGQTKNLKIMKMPEKVKTKPNTYPRRLGQVELTDQVEVLHWLASVTGYLDLTRCQS